jgi:YgiT-type zinc finger domain-containing protein
MKCVICKTGETKPGTTTVTFDREGSTIIIRSVPAEVCTQCGEGYFDEATSKQIDKIAKKAEKDKVIVVIREYQVA